MCLAFGIFCIGLYSEGTAAVTGRHSGWVSQSQDFVPSCKSTKPIPSLRKMSAEYGNSWIWNSTGRAFKRHYNFGELVVGAGSWLKDFKRILFHILYKKKFKVTTWLARIRASSILPCRWLLYKAWKLSTCTILPTSGVSPTQRQSENHPVSMFVTWNPLNINRADLQCVQVYIFYLIMI